MGIMDENSLRHERSTAPSLASRTESSMVNCELELSTAPSTSSIPSHPSLDQTAQDYSISMESFSTDVEKSLAKSIFYFPKGNFESNTDIESFSARPTTILKKLDDSPHPQDSSAGKIPTREQILLTEDHEMSLAHKVAFICVVCLAQFLSLGGMNQTVAPVMILADYFNINDYGNLSWFSAAYSMTVGTFILPAGRLGDIYGHKRMFLIGWVWFAVWSLICGFGYITSNVIFFSIFRAFQGIGPALLVPNAIALLGRNFKVGTERNTAFACFGAAGPTGATAGALLTALIAERFWWPWCFWILAIVCICTFFLTLLVIPGKIVQDKGIQRPPFDHLGCLTGVTGLLLVNFALNQAPLVGWTMWYIPSLLILGLAFLFAFIVVELQCTKHPLIPLRGLGSSAYFALGCIAAGWGSHGIWAYYLYLFLEQVKGHSAILTSQYTSPVAVTGVLFAISTVWLVRRLPVSYVMCLAMLFFLAGSLLLATVPISQTYWLQTFITIIIMPGAMNLSFPAATILLSNALPKDKQGIAASLVATMVNYCIASGLGLAGTIHRHSLENAWSRHEGRQDRNGRPPPGPPPSITSRSPELDQIRIEAMRGPWWFAVGLSSIGVLIAGVSILKTKRRTVDG